MKTESFYLFANKTYGATVVFSFNVLHISCLCNIILVVTNKSLACGCSKHGFIVGIFKLLFPSRLQIDYKPYNLSEGVIVVENDYITSDDER